MFKVCLRQIGDKIRYGFSIIGSHNFYNSFFFLFADYSQSPTTSIFLSVRDLYFALPHRHVHMDTLPTCYIGTSKVKVTFLCLLTYSSSKLSGFPQSSKPKHSKTSISFCHLGTLFKSFKKSCPFLLRNSP